MSGHPLANDSNRSRRHTCPVNGLECLEVSAVTIRHQVKDASGWEDGGQRYYFCADPNCEVVYFGEDGSIISRHQVKNIGVKDVSADSLVCHCFGISKAAAASDPSLKEYVIQKTRLGLCSCQTSNPSGRCCLKDFPDKK